EADIGQVHDGQHASFTVDAYPNRKFPATISQVRYGPRTIQGVVTYQTVLMVDNNELLLRPGMTATAMIVVQEIKDAILLPNTALRFQPPVAENNEGRGLVGSLLPHPPRSFLQHSRAPAETAEREVWILQDNKLAPVKIVVGATDGSMTQVLSGDLRPSMQVVTDIATHAS
ncbi:MAG TPA: efflux RND transporter periplasmic adaptor subunit, partial [Gammaproteobacteria bacterium]